MGRQFLPALRAAVPAGLRAATHPAARDSELKVVLGDYYAALASTGVWNMTRARPWPVERAVAEGFERIIWVFKSTQAISGHASRLPFRLRQGDAEVDDHPLYWLLNGGTEKKRANPLETGPQFRNRLGSQILLSKRGAFVQVTKARSGTPVRLDLLPPGRTRPVPGEGGVLLDHFEVVRADGTRAEIPADEVIWFRDPHPLDPYSGVTPLEAAGMSVELDFFSRLYNVQFLKNDARPGGVIAVNGDMDEEDMDRLERKFAHGPAEAGKLTVVAGDISYVDSVVRPRDMQYDNLSGNAKTEILCAFGVPESIMGFAADRTYANAEQEHLNFWQITMPPHMAVQVTGFDTLSEDNLEGFFDVSTVEVLQKAEALKRQEALGEFQAGTITLDEYRTVAGRDPFDRPETRCLYMPQGLTPVATSEADAKAMSGAPPPGAGGQDGSSPSPSSPPPGAGGDDGGLSGDSDSGSGDNSPAGGEDSGGGNGETKRLPPRPRQLTATAKTPETRPVLRIVRQREHKQAPGPRSGDADAESVPGDQAQDQLEVALAAALSTLAARWTERTVARLRSPKSRKGTRHWVPDSEYKQDTRAGDQALDASGVADGPRWQAEAQSAVAPIIEAAAIAAGAALAADLASSPPGEMLTAAVRQSAQAVAQTVTAVVGAAAAGLADRVATAINQADQSGQDIGAIEQAARQEVAHANVWADGVARQAATATIAGARDAAAQQVATLDPEAVSRDIVRVWRSRRDDHVRTTHRETDGQKQPLGVPFIVGDSLLRYPGDPAGPPGETFGCRCRLQHRSVPTGQYVTTPPGEVTRRIVRRVAAPA